MVLGGVTALSKPMKWVLLSLTAIAQTSCGGQEQQPSENIHDASIQQVLSCTRESSIQVATELPWFDPNITIEEAQYGLQKLRGRDISKACIDQSVQAYLSSWMRHCSDNGCGDDIGGGCAHLSGLREGIPAYAATAHCSLKMRDEA